MTTPDRIIDLLDRHPEGLTDTEIAHILNLPKPSVRRTRSQLEGHRVFFVDSLGPFRSNRYNTVAPSALPTVEGDEPFNPDIYGV